MHVKHDSTVGDVTIAVRLTSSASKELFVRACGEERSARAPPQTTERGTSSCRRHFCTRSSFWLLRPEKLSARPKELWGSLTDIFRLGTTKGEDELL
ncbi:hypothetical protein GN956_G3493 [Arapaima gigas]